MSKTIDQRVVEMRFDNKQFESATATTMSTIDKLKQKLNFTGATKGLDDVSSAAKRVDMSAISKGVEAVQVKFSALQTVAVTALANITNSAVNAGKQIISALTIDPVLSGFQEYETQINAVQTILANTSHAGTTLEQVNATLDDLNTYADKTIYNFTEMTKNIGTFTAAGVGLKDSAEAIKGIANLAAMSGSTSAQASTAMYQLSQALAAGTVNLQDWNSVVNAGMGGKVFQDALIRTAAAMKGVSEETFRAENITTTFRESISTQGGTGWLDGEVLLNTLRQFTGDLSTAELAAMGFTEAQIKNIQSMAQTANDAATKVKTVTQLFDTLKESLQSGWTQTWEILIGDFEEARTLLTDLSDTFGGIINSSAEARNTLLYDSMTSNWKKITDGINEAGLSADDFKTKVSEIGKSEVKDFDKIVEEYGSLEEAFKNGAISSEILDKALISMTGTSAEVAKKLNELSGDYKTNDDILKALTEAGYEYSEIQNLVTKDTEGQKIALNDLTDAQLMSIGYTEEQVLSIRELSEQAELAGGSLKKFMDDVAVPQGREILVESLKTGLYSLIDVFGAVGKAWQDVFPPMTSDQLLDIIKSVDNFVQSLKPSEETLDRIQRSFRGLFSVFSLGKQAIIALISPFGELLGGVGDLSGGILELTASFGDWLYSLNNSAKTGDFFSAFSDGLSSFLGKVRDTISSVIGNFDGLGDVFSSIGETISNVFSKVFDVLSKVVNWIRENISAGDVFAGLAGGGIFIAFKKFSGLIDKVKEIFESFGDSGGSIKDNFTDILGSVHDTLEGFSEGIQVASLVGIATAVTLLTSSLQKIAELEPEQIAYSLVTVRLLIASLNSGFKSLTKTLSKFNAKGTIKAGLAMIAMAEAVNIISDALVKFADLSWEELIKGLAGVGGALIELSVAIKIIDGVKISLRTSVALIAIAKACQTLSEALVGFAELDWDEIARGLTAMGGALLEVTAALSILSKVGGGGALLGSVGVLIAVQALDEISENLKKLGGLSWEEIGKGLTAMGGAFTELIFALGILSKVVGFGAILGGTAILIAVQSLDEISENLERLGNLSWDEIGRGLAAMGGALAEVGVVTGALGKLAGFSGILGSGSILITVQSLEKLAEALSSFGSMSWDEIGRGLAAMGGALLEVGAVSGGLGMLAGISGMFGAGTIWIATQGLQDLATALQSFASMEWDEIGRGLVAMGGALLEVGAISGALGFLTGIAGLVGAGTITLASQGLDEIANALIKFGSMDWDEIGRGLSAMGGAMAETALGGLLNTFSGFGASAIAEMAEPLGNLADSIKRWEGVSVPEGLGLQLGSLASGVRSFNFSGFGADAIAAVAIPIGDMADSIKKWQDVSVPEKLGKQIASLAEGVKAFTFGGFGADALAEAVPGLGDMAGAVKKWKDVTIPEGLEEGLTSIANGIKAFTFAFVAGWSMDVINQPLIDLAGAVKKWKDVSIPEGIDEGLTQLADGVKAFSFAFVGGWSIDAIKEPLGELADSVKKWDGINITGVGPQLTELSDGLKSLKEADIGSKFNKNLSGFFDAFSNESVNVAISNIGGLVSALGQMALIDASSITTFSTALENLGNVSVSGLVTSLQNGAEQAGAAVTSIIITMQSSLFNGAIILGQTAANAGTTMSTSLINGLNDGLSNLSSTISSVVASAAIALGSQTAAFKTVGTSFGKNVVDGAKVSMSELPKSLSTTVSLAVSSMKEKANGFRETGVLMMSNLTKGFQDGTNGLKVAAAAMITSLTLIFTSSYAQFNKTGVNIITQIILGVTSQQTAFVLVFTNLIAAALTAIKNKLPEFETSGQNAMTKFIAGVRSRDYAVREAFTGSLGGALSAVRDYYDDFYAAGEYLAGGLAAGLEDNVQAAIDSAIDMAQSAANAIDDELQIRSPSRVSRKSGNFFGMGFVLALKDYAGKAYDASEEMATKAKSGLAKAIAGINDFIDSGIDTQPTIRPVLDLTNLESGTRRLNTLFSRNQAMSVNTRMNRMATATFENQNGVTATPAGNTYQFTQNNYSPKALSRVDIYRQTKNQFSAFGRAVKA